MGVGGRGASNLENKEVIVKFSGKEGGPRGGMENR